MDKFNALTSQYQSLLRDLSIALGSAVLEPAQVTRSPEHSTQCGMYYIL